MNKIQSTQGIDLAIEVNGRPTRVFRKNGKHFIESRDGSQYTIKLKNNNFYRVEAVVTVDGLDVITGKDGSKTNSGYIINGYDELVVKGFRASDSEVGAFKFTKKEKSYAAADKGKPSNVGVIAVVVFREKEIPKPVIKEVHHHHDWNDCNVWPRGWRYPYNDTWYRCNGTTSGIGDGTTTTHLGDVRRSTDNTCYGSDANTQTYYATNCSTVSDIKGDRIGGGILRSANVCQSSAEPEEPRARSLVTEESFVAATHGTQWGEKIVDKIRHVVWERGENIFTEEIFYNDRDSLEEMGISFVQEKQVSAPTGFPGDYCKPPVGWKE